MNLLAKIISTIVLIGLVAIKMDCARADSEVISLSGNDIVFDESQTFYWAEGDKSGEDPSKLPPERWTRATKRPNIGPGERPVWYRFSLSNDLTSDAQVSFVSIGAASSEMVELVVDHGAGLREFAKTGTAISMNERPVTSRLLVLPFTLKGNERATAYLGISSHYSRNLLYQIKYPNSLVSYETNTLLFFGFFFGLFTYFMLINVISYLKFRLTLSLTYALFCLSVFAPAFVGDGFLNLLIPRDWIVKTGSIQIVLIPLQIAAAAMLSRDYLNLKTWNKPAYWVASILAGAALLSAAIATTGRYGTELLYLDSVLAVTCAVFALLVAIYAMYTDEPTYEKSYILGFGSYIVMAIIWTLQNQGTIPTTWWTANGVLVGEIIQNAVVSYVVLRRMNSLLVNIASAGQAKQYADKLSTLVRVLSHDLSNYLAVIIFNSRHLAREGISRNEAGTRLESISRAANQQAEIINSIRQIQDLETSRSSLTLEPVNLNNLVRELRDNFAQSLNDKEVKLTTTDFTNGELLVLADHETLLKQVLSKLVCNAIKFSSSGGEIQIIAKPSDSNVLIEVTDRGIGIPEKIKSGLFRSISTAPRAGTNGEKGTGFGLSIAKAYIDTFGGSISVSSRCKNDHPTDHGTTFTIELIGVRSKG
jgi:signal transduction histidine kinase